MRASEEAATMAPCRISLRGRRVDAKTRLSRYSGKCRSIAAIWLILGRQRCSHRLQHDCSKRSCRPELAYTSSRLPDVGATGKSVSRVADCASGRFLVLKRAQCGLRYSAAPEPSS